MFFTNPKKRYWRTLILAIIACATLVWVAMDSFDIPPQQMLVFFTSLLLGALVIVLAAGLVVLACVGLQRLVKRSRR